jgi:hypothetical protein
MIDNVIKVHLRDEWKKALTSKGFLKGLSQAGIIGKEDGLIQPHEVMNQWTLAFFYDEYGVRQVLELGES